MNPTLSWLLSEPVASFFPERLQLSTLGHATIERRLNLSLSRWPTLWQKWIWPRIETNIFTYVQSIVLPQLQCAFNEPQVAARYVQFVTELRHSVIHSNPDPSKVGYLQLFDYLSQQFILFGKSIGQGNNLFEATKLQYNDAFLSTYETLREELLLGKNHRQFSALIYLAAQANAMGSTHLNRQLFVNGFGESVNQILDSGEDIEYEETHNPFFQPQWLSTHLTGHPKTILYEVDSAGEIILDLLLIEHFIQLGHRVTVSAHLEPFLRKITATDLQKIVAQKPFSALLEAQRMGKFEIIDNGATGAARMFGATSTNYQDAYTRCDFVLSKGGDNFLRTPSGVWVDKQLRPYRYRKPFVALFNLSGEACQMAFTRAFGKKTLHLQGRPIVVASTLQ